LKPRLLIVELWGLGDLVIATPFLRAATERFEVTLLAKPYAIDLQDRFLPGVKVIPFLAPWTAFKHKYRVWSWPWGDLFRLRRTLHGQFDVGLSARWDPRDHFLLAVARVRRRLGFPRVGSQWFLTEPLERPAPPSHRYEYWRVLADSLGFPLPSQAQGFVAEPSDRRSVLIHTGAGQPVRVWPLERYRLLVQFLRENGHPVIIVCDPAQRDWWIDAGEREVATPRTVKELIGLLDRSAVFIGNDSGPGHLAALAGVPTFTLFGPQLSEWFAPLHPQAEVIEGKPCPYKPCSDYCRFPVPICLHGISAEEVCARIERFVERHVTSDL
jgi:heptosyltransferase-2